jgi:hypothetical protein
MSAKGYPVAGHFADFHPGEHGPSLERWQPACGCGSKVSHGEENRGQHFESLQNREGFFIYGLITVIEGENYAFIWEWLASAQAVSRF